MTRNILLATLFTLGTAIALVTVFLTEKTVRLPEASAAVSAVQIERGALDYEQYCAQCHGIAGQGAANETGAPSINNIVFRKLEVRDKNDAKSSEFEQQYGIKEKYGTIRNYIVATLISGIKGTAMPAWGQEAGGPLRRDQIENITSYVLSWNDATGAAVPPSTVNLAATLAAQNRPTADDSTPFTRGKTVFSTKACVGCHYTDSRILNGPGLGGLLQEGGTAAYGTKLPNGNDISEPSLLDWILKGTAGFPEKHVGLNPDPQFASLADRVMPGIALTDKEYQDLLVYLRAFNQDGSIVPGADAAPAVTAGAEGLPTSRTTPNPAASAGSTSITGGNAQRDTTATAETGNGTSGPAEGPSGPSGPAPGPAPSAAP